MTYPVHQVPAGDVLPIFFDTYAGATGASITLTGLAVTDIEIYKDGGATQRASDAGYTLLDTDGIDFDGITGIHGFSIDTGDNTDAGFYTVGAWFHVVVSAVTVDGQTVNFVAAAFRIMAAEGVAGVPDVNVTHVADTSQTAGDIIADTNDIQARLPAALVSGRIDASVGAMAANVMTAAAAAADLTTELQAGLATAADLSTVAGYLDTEIAAILADTNELQTDWANGGRLDLILDARASQASVDTIDTNVDSILVDTAEIGAAGAGLTALASAANLATLAGYVDTEVASIKAVTDKLDTMLLNSSDGWIWTIAALQDAPGGTLTAGAIADAVWQEPLADHSGTAGSTAEALNAAGAAGDPWITALPGAYSAGQAGYIVGNSLDATISSRASQTSVNAIDDFVDTEVAAIKVVTDKLDTTLELTSDGQIFTALALQNAPVTPAGLDAAGVRAAVGLAAANLDTQLAAIDTKTTNLPTDPADQSLVIAATDAIMTRLGAPAGASVSADIAALPTAAENATAVMGSTVEGTFDLTESARLWNAAAAGKASGLATTTAVFRDLADTKDRITATVDADGNRSAVTRDVT